MAELGDSLLAHRVIGSKETFDPMSVTVNIPTAIISDHATASSAMSRTHRDFYCNLIAEHEKFLKDHRRACKLISTKRRRKMIAFAACSDDGQTDRPVLIPRIHIKLWEYAPLRWNSARGRNQLAAEARFRKGE